MALLLTDSRPTQAQGEIPDLAFDEAHFMLGGGVIGHSSPVLADITGDNVPEILIATLRLNGATGSYDRPGVLAAFLSSGALLWQRELPGSINSTPAVGDIDNDGTPEIVVGVGGEVLDPYGQGGVYALDHLGNVRWIYSSRDYGVPDGRPDGVFSSPTLCDVNNDGLLETIFGSWDHWIYLLDHNGQSLWNSLPNNLPGPGYHNADTIWSSPACADLNNDGQKEIIIGTDITAGGVLPDGTHPDNGGFLFVFDRFGNPLVRRFIPEALYSSVAVGDLNRDGTPELVIGTSDSFWRQGIRPQPYVYAFSTANVFNSGMHYSDPNKLPDLPGWPVATAYPGFSSPALADLDSDGDLEIVIGSGKPYGESTSCTNNPADGNCYGALYAWHHNGAPVAGFPMWPKDYLNKNSGIFSSPTVGDLDSDGIPEIVITLQWDVIVISNHGQQLVNLTSRYKIGGSATIGDADHDNRAEIWVGGSHINQPSSGTLWRFESTLPHGVMSWMQFRSDPPHNGSYLRAPTFTTWPQQVLHNPGWGTYAASSATVLISDSQPVTWRILGVPSRIQLLTPTGTVTDRFSIPYRINTSGLPNGVHQLGSIRLDGVVNATRQQVAPVEIPVTLILGPVRNTYLPLTTLR